MNEKKTLYIPQGLKTRVEIFSGYGKEELHKTILAVLIIGVLDLMYFVLFRNIVIGMVVILTGIAGSVMMLTKDNNNISVVDQVMFMFKFAKSQKVYKYKYLDEWGWESGD